MKWLILFLLVSCGKDKMPKEVDMGDNDGDQIPNHLETKEKKNIADFQPVGEVNGEMIFSVGSIIKQEHILKLSNKRDTQTESLDILTRSETKIISEDYFSEFSKIKLELPMKKIELVDRIYELSFTFLPTVSNPDYLLLIKGKEYIKLEDFGPSMKIKITMKDLELLLKSEAHLAFGKTTMVKHYIDSQSIQETIREKTYRIFLNDGQDATILYIAKDFSFEKLLETKNLETVINYNDINPFQYSFSGKQWFFRDLPGGDKVLVLTGQQEMVSSFFNNYKKTDIQIQRANGSRVNSLKIDKNVNSIIHLKIRPTQTTRTFREYIETARHMMSQDKWKCTNYIRTIDTEFTIQPSMDEILTDLMFSFNGATSSLSQLEHTLSLKEDEISQYILVTLRDMPQNLEVYLQNKADDTYISTGQYDLNCDKGYPVRGSISVVPTNYEGHLTLTLEAYVEKLD